MPSTKSKVWCFTINNYDVPVNYAPTHMEYLIYGREIGASGTPHYQGTLFLFRSMKLTDVQKLLYPSDPKRVHLEPTKAALASISYCSKDGDYIEQGLYPKRLIKRDAPKFREIKTIIWQASFASFAETYPDTYFVVQNRFGDLLFDGYDSNSSIAFYGYSIDPKFSGLINQLQSGLPIQVPTTRGFTHVYHNNIIFFKHKPLWM